jgi:hypothetical protein
LSRAQKIELDKDELIIPIYIDTNTLLDLLASIEGGFSVVEKMTSHSTRSRSSDQSIKGEGGTEFGIPNVLNLIKVTLGGALSWRQGREEGEEWESDRYNTYGSLFQRLRSVLTDQGLVKKFDGDPVLWDTIEPHDFIELRGKILPNPLTDSLGTIERLLRLFEVFAQVATPKNSRSNKQNHKQVQPSLLTLNNQIPLNQVKQIHTFIAGMINQLEGNDIRTIIVDFPLSKNYRAVASLFTEYLRDPSMAELLHKEYKLFGKVVGKISDEASSIDLLQGTALSGISEVKISQLLDQLNQPNNDLRLPKTETAVKAPALQIVPIAIYV